MNKLRSLEGSELADALKKILQLAKQGELQENGELSFISLLSYEVVIRITDRGSVMLESNGLEHLITPLNSKNIDVQTTALQIFERLGLGTIWKKGTFVAGD